MALLTQVVLTGRKVQKDRKLMKRVELAPEIVQTNLAVVPTIASVIGSEPQDLLVEA